MSKTIQLSALQALTGAVARKQEEGAWRSEASGVVYHFDTLTDSLMGWLRDQATGTGGELLQNTFVRWICRAAWRACTVDGERMDIPQETMRFNGATQDGSGFIQVATWESVAALGADMMGLAMAIVLHVEQQTGERQRLGFTDGSSQTATDAGSPIAPPVTTADHCESLLTM